MHQRDQYVPNSPRDASAGPSTAFVATPSSTGRGATSRGQIHALIHLNTLLFRRQALLNVCCISLCPLGLMALVGLLCLTVGNAIRGAPSSTTLFCSRTPPLSASGLPLDFDPIRHPPNLTSWNHAGFYTNSPTRVFARRYPCQLWFGTEGRPLSSPYSLYPQAENGLTDTSFISPPKGGWMSTGITSLSANTTGGEGGADLTGSIYAPPSRPPFSIPWYFYTTEQGLSVGQHPKISTGPTVNSSNEGGFLMLIPSSSYPSPDGPQIAPWFEPTLSQGESSAALAKSIADLIEFMDMGKNLVLQAPPLPAHGSIHFSHLDVPHQRLQVTLQMGSTRRLASDPRLFRLYPSQGMRQLIAHSRLVAALVRQKYGGRQHITSGIRAFPNAINPVTDMDVSSMIGAYFFPFAISFLLPLFVESIVRDREERLYQMMRMCGMKPWIYFLVQYTTFSLFQWITSVIFIGTGWAFQMSLFSRTSPLVYVILLLFWAHIQALLAFCLAKWMKGRRRAMIHTSAFVLFTLILHFIISPIFREQGGMSWIWYLHPCWVFYQALAHMSLHASMQHGTEPLMMIDLFSGFFGLCLGLLIAHSALMMLFLSEWPQKAYQRLKGMFKKHPHPICNGIPPESAIMVDEDVQEEKRTVKRLVESEDLSAIAFPLVVSSLTHQYSSSGVNSLDNVSFSVETGSVFGLLGPNGAGKSTLIHLLTGMIPIEHGSAYISGKDIQKTPWESHAAIGICPQHDIHWGELTVEEHLIVYAKLRGAQSRDQVKDMVNDILFRMNLTHVRYSYAEVLSGGERRRLSIGLAILGGQSVIFLDEPTTGLDPDARRMIWRIIQDLRKTSTTIILTTHSMEEAEALCGRIAIMNRGQVQVIGSPVHLRDKFSQGFRLTLTYQTERKQGVLRFLKSILPANTRITEDIGSSLVLEFPSSIHHRVAIGPIMRSIDMDGRTHAGILEWAIGQTSLETVFLHIIDSSTVD